MVNDDLWEHLNPGDPADVAAALRQLAAYVVEADDWGWNRNKRWAASIARAVAKLAAARCRKTRERRCTYLDRKALEIAEIMVPILRERLPGWEVSNADPDSPYASERHDRGAFIMAGNPNDPDHGADIRVEIPCSQGYDGTDEGWGFGLACTAFGESVGPGFIISNFTSSVWTRDRREIRSRLDDLRGEAEAQAEACAAWLLGED